MLLREETLVEKGSRRLRTQDINRVFNYLVRYYVILYNVTVLFAIGYNYSFDVVLRLKLNISNIETYRYEIIRKYDNVYDNIVRSYNYRVSEVPANSKKYNRLYLRLIVGKYL